MIAEAISLIEFISGQLSKVQGKKDKLLEQFVEPAYSKLQIIHEDYIRACHKYWDEIKNDQPLNLVKVINTIDQDVRFAPHESRIDLLASLQLVDPLFQDFINSIQCYLLGSQAAVRQAIIYNTSHQNLNRRVSGAGIKTSLLEVLEKFSRTRWTIQPDEIALLKQGKIVLRSPVGYTMELEPDNPLRDISNDPNEATKSFDEYIRYRALAYVDCFIAILQKDYAAVMNSYWALKRKLQGIS